ncbi:protein LSM14 homolog car-1-like isoform X3 [Atheta coriaria]|uniref:protein LSM14 homolog car-1-like isoform X3 n=1 Tax=Dalotia coriaria TaxID=877792 RepID=UPI0031F4042D
MSTGMPELGSKISLISKADIRYEGHLFTVDPQQCTIALAAVRSFGTEERETNYPVPPQNQVYDYILFRGSDIKDIRVVNNVTSMPNDPAIMQLSVPNPLSNKPFQAQGFPHPGMGQMGQFAGGYSAMEALAPGMRGPMGNNKPSELNMPGPVPPPHLSPAVMEPPRPNENGGGSRSTTPASVGSRKSSTTEQGTQAGGKKDEKKVIRPIQPPRGGKDRRDSRGESQDRKNHNKHRNHHSYHQGGQHQQQHHHQMQQQQRQGNWVPRGPMRQRARGRPRGGGGNFGGPQGSNGFKPTNRQQGQGQGGKPKITFDKEYDFEQANTQFEEMCGKLAKTKLEDTPKPELNGGGAPPDIDKKDDSGNETGAGENELEEDVDGTFYDKTKSFFDNISCEAVERSKGRSQRTDWRTERKLNSETFGVASARRGSYRGRGGYRGGFRGGYRGGYRNNQQHTGNKSHEAPGETATRTNAASETVTSPSVTAAESNMTPVVVAPVTKTAPAAN